MYSYCTLQPPQVAADCCYCSTLVGAVFLDICRTVCMPQMRLASLASRLDRLKLAVVQAVSKCTSVMHGAVGMPAVLWLGQGLAAMLSFKAGNLPAPAGAIHSEPSWLFAYLLWLLQLVLTASARHLRPPHLPNYGLPSPWIRYRTLKGALHPMQ